MKKIITIIGAAAVLAAACSHTQENDMQAKVDEYAIFEVKSPLMDELSDKDKQVLNLLHSETNPSWTESRTRPQETSQ